jgi:septum formation protein
MGRIILASGSTIRAKLLTAAGVSFDVVPADVDEGALRAGLAVRDTIEPNAVAGALALAKAQAVSRLHPGATVIGADQVLWLDPHIYEKPKDLTAARDHLTSLRGKTHELHCGVALAVDGDAVWATVRAARLTMREFSDTFLDAYIARAGADICHCVGAYEYEGLGLQLFDAVDGDYFTILGLPMMPLLTELRARGSLAS